MRLKQFLHSVAAGCFGVCLWLIAVFTFVCVYWVFHDTGAILGALMIMLCWLAPAGVLAVAAMSWNVDRAFVERKRRLFGFCVAGTLVGFGAFGLYLWGGSVLTDAFPGESYLYRDLYKEFMLPALILLPAFGASSLWRLLPSRWR